MRNPLKRTFGTAAIFASLLVIPSFSHAWTVDFESAPGASIGSGYDLFNGDVTQSTAQAQSGTHSIRFGMASESDQPVLRFLPSSNLGSLNATYSAYVSTGSPDLAPYMYFGVDANQNGSWDSIGGGDAFVLAFSGGAIPSTIPHDQWFMTGLDGLTNVHVVGNRSGLAAGTYDSSGTQDTLDSLRQMTFSGATTWGDLNVMRAYIAAGEWPGVSSYEAFVDDVNFSPVPEPATMAVLGLGAIGVLRRRRKQAPRN